jgi:hypothetical protein
VVGDEASDHALSRADEVGTPRSVEPPEDGYHRAMRVTVSTRIESSPEQVFDTLADVRNDAWFLTT